MPSPRVRPVIDLTSPEGKNFTPKWVGNKRSNKKRLGRWKYAGINGEVIDDYGLDSDVYPMKLIFDGITYDTDAERFLKATAEFGSWEVIHPTKGYKALNLVSWDESDQPVEKTNLIEIETVWNDYIDPFFLKTPAQMLAEAGATLNAFNADLLNRYQDVDVGTFSERASLLDTAKRLGEKINQVLGPIAAANDKVSSSFMDSQQALQEIISAGIVEPLALAGQIKDTIQTPMLATRDLKARLAGCRDLARAIFEIESGDNGDRNIAMTKELGLMSLAGSVSISQTTSDIGETNGIATQKEAVDTISFSRNFSNDITEHLEEEQEKMDGQLVGRQYMYGGGILSSKLNSQLSAEQYIRSNFFNLAKEKIITLDRPRTPIDVVIEFYGGMGDNDENYRKFLTVNEVKGAEVSLLKQGRQILIYV